MLKAHWRIISRLERIGDNILIVAAFYGTYAIRDQFLRYINAYILPLPADVLELGTLESYYIILGVALPLFNAFLSLLGAYRSMRFSSVAKLLRISIMAAALVFLCQGSFLYLLKLDVSRSFVAIFCGISAIFLFAERLGVLALLRFFRARGRNFRNILIVGTGREARRVYQEIVRQPELGIRAVGFVAPERREGDTPEIQTGECESHVYDLPARVVADRDSFEAALKKFAVDEVLCADIIQHFSITRSLAEIASEEGVQVTLAADVFSLGIYHSELAQLGALSLIQYHPAPGVQDSVAMVMKRAIDVVLSSFLLVFLSPLLVLVAGLIRLDSRGPVFFRQKRVGKSGRIFTLLKFRSMVANAEDMLGALKDRNEMNGPVFKITNDPRVTRFGKIIRRFSIDELPQLINVLRGDMSLVGPRPPLPVEVEGYKRRQRRRLSMRPGLTCTWQVSGRSEILDFERWAELDLAYVDNWSLWNDFKLILRTVPAVLLGVGAK